MKPKTYIRPAYFGHSNKKRTADMHQHNVDQIKASRNRPDIIRPDEERFILRRIELLEPTDA